MKAKENAKENIKRASRKKDNVEPPESKMDFQYLRCCRKCGKYHKVYTNKSGAICKECRDAIQEELLQKVTIGGYRGRKERLKEEKMVGKVKELFGDDVNSLFLS